MVINKKQLLLEKVLFRMISGAKFLTKSCKSQLLATQLISFIWRVAGGCNACRQGGSWIAVILNYCLCVLMTVTSEVTPLIYKNPLQQSICIVWSNFSGCCTPQIKN